MMTALLKREPRSADLVDRFDRMFEDMMSGWVFRTPVREWFGKDVLKVDEFEENGELVIRAEMPGVDPDKDVTVTVDNGMLHLSATHREEKEVEERGYFRRELRSGTYMRTLPLPEGVTDADIKPTFTNGILEIRVPAPEMALAKKIPITKA
jgi:HSP20 family protein